MVKANWWRPIPALALLVAATVLSAKAGTPGDLPGAALGWPLLLHLERAVALVAGLALVVLVGTRATMGQFPFRLGQIEYAMAEMTDQLGNTKRLHQEQLSVLAEVLRTGPSDSRYARMEGSYEKSASEKTGTASASVPAQPGGVPHLDSNPPTGDQEATRRD